MIIINVNEGEMNYSAEICRAVLDGQSLAEAIYDRVGITEKVGDALVGKLCGEGVITNARGRLAIANRARAEIIAEGASPKGKAPVATAVLATPSPKRRAPPPVPPNIVIRKNVPCPPPRVWLSARPILWPFTSMMVGDSFSIDVPDGYTPKEVANSLSADTARFVKANPEYHFAVRIAADGKSVGVWRDEGKPKPGTKPGPAVTPPAASKSAGAKKKK